jgi:hypothetical protein
MKMAQKYPQASSKISLNFEKKITDKKEEEEEE